ncbi:hypothetical protein J6590_078143 [Homalodisca vitripennis]|nr:hypothetical protein J6590_078143 [Homalodisca vitripennis]
MHTRSFTPVQKATNISVPEPNDGVQEPASQARFTPCQRPRHNKELRLADYAPPTSPTITPILRKFRFSLKCQFWFGRDFTNYPDSFREPSHYPPPMDQPCPGLATGSREALGNETFRSTTANWSVCDTSGVEIASLLDFI